MRIVLALALVWITALPAAALTGAPERLTWGIGAGEILARWEEAPIHEGPDLIIYEIGEGEARRLIRCELEENKLVMVAVYYPFLPAKAANHIYYALRGDLTQSCRIVDGPVAPGAQALHLYEGVALRAALLACMWNDAPLVALLTYEPGYYQRNRERLETALLKDLQGDITVFAP